MTARLLEHELERDRLTGKIERFEEASRVFSHDLRNPLNVAQGRIELELAQRECENLAIASRSLDRIEEIISSVLRVAREGRAVTETSHVSLSALAERCWESISAPDATLVVDEDFAFHADPDRVRRVFENLFRNAIEHGGSGVTIRVGALPEGGGIYVEDDGSGIPEADRETVFDAGYTTGTDGAGLGLAIVESTVEAHGWSIAVTDAENGGARFEIRDVVPA
ncbi:sensor histidine kinase [Halobellus rufus]|uniref:sensor histidine kinase n=1 Tax=Halobellus rufus TaxID=1448860 RepID=UPI000678E6A5|nr:HAMP domain-containing sensor histidine kinase [Halobellus rufus]